MRIHRELKKAIPLIALAACWCPGGCAGFRSSSPGTLATANSDARFGPANLTATEVQSEVMSFTDTFIGVASEQWAQVEHAALIATGPPAPGERDAEQAAFSAHEIKLANVTAAVSIASRPNPIIAAADIITLLTLQRRALEDPWAAEAFGPQVAASLAEAYREQEAAARRIGAGVFFPEQEAELVALIDKWRADHPDRRDISGVRMEDFGRDRSQTMIDETGSPTGLFALVNLDTATREVEKSRLLGERVFFYSEHLPTILRWQAEGVYLGALRTPQTRQALAAVGEMSTAAEGISRAAQQFPQDLSVERQAALTQLFDGLTEQRAALLKDIDQGQANLQGSLRELRAAVEATSALSASATQTLNAANSLAAKFVPEGGPAPSDPSRDVWAEYRAAAEQTSRTAERLTTLAERIDTLLASPSLSPAGTQGTLTSIQSSVQQIVDHAFWRLLILACVAPILVLAALGLARRTAAALKRPDPRRP